jgi:uncharacterized protein (DUF1697 family)
MKEIVARAPDGFGSDPAAYRYNVIFLKEPMTATEAMKSVSTKEGVDAAFTGKGVLYFSILISKATQSHISRIVSLPVSSMIIRNWNTTIKLLKMMEPTSDYSVAGQEACSVNLKTLHVPNGIRDTAALSAQSPLA